MVPSPRFLGIDEGPFRFQDPTAVVLGVLTRGAHTVEAVVVDRVLVDGWDATHAVLRLARRLPGSGAQRILIDGVTLGGMNLVDLQEVADRLRIPVIGVARQEPEAGGLEKAAERTSDPKRRRALLPKKPPVKIALGTHALWVQAHEPDHGPVTDSDRIAALLGRSLAQGATPEPLRLAHHIATAIVRGVSGTSP